MSMTGPAPLAPTRADVATTWEALLAGQISREEAHTWAAPWVEHRFDEVSDPMTMNGLQHLHGFNLKHDPGKKPDVVWRGAGGTYLHSDHETAESLTRWRMNCDRYDADPAEYVRQAREHARLALEAEQ
jgi:hypothetical protein